MSLAGARSGFRDYRVQLIPYAEGETEAQRGGDFPLVHPASSGETQMQVPRFPGQIPSFGLIAGVWGQSFGLELSGTDNVGGPEGKWRTHGSRCHGSRKKGPTLS